jgi:hypothetical protein
MTKKLKLAAAMALIAAASLCGKPACADVWDQKGSDTPKWSRAYVELGRSTGDYGGTGESFSVNYLGFKQMRGRFSYGVETGFISCNGDKVSSTNATMSLRPDWTLDAEPSLDFSYGLADLSGPAPGRSGSGTIASVGISLDVFKISAFSVTASAKSSFLSSDAPAVKSANFQAVTMSLNFNIY